MQPINIIGLGVVGLIVVLYGAEAALRWWHWHKTDKTPPSIVGKRQ
jgi:hypothetical protein